ncbi:MAG: ABC transporter permease [Oligoflexia bacterium]|nr:ABC transporter permease [Oligoflexia bacterium]
MHNEVGQFVSLSYRAVYAVWLRYFAVFRKNWFYGLVTTFAEPILFLLSFGLGLGSLIGTLRVGGVSVGYRPFVLAGIVGQTVLIQGFFEASYGGFVRMYYQRIFQAIAVTPVTLSEVLWGETAWGASRATLAASAVLIIGVALGDFSVLGALLLVPACFVFSMIFAALGLLVAARSKTIESISYPQYLLVFPMFLFCGVFFPLSQLPVMVQKAAWLFPLTPVLSLVRTLVLGFPLEIQAPFLVIFWVALLVPLSRRFMIGRLLR